MVVIVISGEGHQEVVEQGEGFCRRVCSVEDVPGDEDAVRLQLLGSREDLPEQEAPLLLEHRKGRNALSQMQICQMDEFHFRFDYFMFCSAGGRFRYSTTPRAAWRPRRCRLSMTWTGRSVMKTLQPMSSSCP